MRHFAMPPCHDGFRCHFMPLRHAADYFAMPLRHCHFAAADFTSLPMLFSPLFHYFRRCFCRHYSFHFRFAFFAAAIIDTLLPLTLSPIFRHFRHAILLLRHYCHYFDITPLPLLMILFRHSLFIFYDDAIGFTRRHAADTLYAYADADAITLMLLFHFRRFSLSFDAAADPLLIIIDIATTPRYFDAIAAAVLFDATVIRPMALMLRCRIRPRCCAPPCPDAPPDVT
jgi:hypothetical protein